MGKNQHYVPQFYLKRFSNDSRSIGTWVANSNKIVERASIANMASKANLYGSDQTIEKWLSAEEEKWSKLIRKINSLEDINCFEDYFDLLYFITITLNRTLRVADRNNYVNDFFGKLMLSGRIPEKELAEMNFDTEIPNLPALQISVEILPILFDLEFLLLENKTTALFITTDNPVCLYNPLYVRRHYNRGYGLSAGGLVIVLPLSTKICLCLFDPMVYECNKGDVVQIKSTSSATEINKLLVRNAYHNVFFNNDQNQSYIKSLVKSYRYISKEEYIKLHMGGNLVQLDSNSIHDPFRLDFLTIKPEYMTLELPLHMGGLTRPIAKEMEKEIYGDEPLSNEIWHQIEQTLGIACKP